MSNSNSSFKFLKEGSILRKSLRSFCRFIAKNGRKRPKKWSVVSVSVPQSHIGLTASLKLWRNLCSFIWLNFNLNTDNNLTPAGSWIANCDFCFRLKKSLNIELTRLISSAFLREVSNLHHSLTEKGKKWLFGIFSSCSESLYIVMFWCYCFLNPIIINI